MQQHQSQQLFTATELADFEYCPLLWWHEQFEPATHEDTENLFARLVELEHEHETLAPSIPEYQLIEQLLMRRGAFEPAELQSEPAEHEMEPEKMEEEHAPIAIAPERISSRRILVILLAMGLLGLLLMAGAVVLR